MTREDVGIEGPIHSRIDEAIARQQEIFRDSFPGVIGVQIDEVRDGYARGSIEVDRRVLHPGGYAHGGALAGFGDSVAAWATFPSLAPDEIFATIEFKANFITGVTGGRLVGEAVVVHKGARTMVIEVKISTMDEEPALVCVMLVTQAIIAPKREDAPSRY